jgi:hypothetical protein
VLGVWEGFAVFGRCRNCTFWAGAAAGVPPATFSGRVARWCGARLVGALLDFKDVWMRLTPVDNMENFYKIYVKQINRQANSFSVQWHMLIGQYFMSLYILPHQ